MMAGVNGLEAGQTFIVACAVLFHNLTELGGAAASNPAVRYGHSASISHMHCHVHGGSFQSAGYGPHLGTT